MTSVGAYGRGFMKEDNENSAPWRQAVKRAAMRARQQSGGVSFSGPVELGVVFGFAKPARAPKRSRIWPVKRSTYDIDKLLRNIFDALVDAKVLQDDSIVVCVAMAKVYCEDYSFAAAEPSAVITVRSVDNYEAMVGFLRSIEDYEVE